MIYNSGLRVVLEEWNLWDKRFPHSVHREAKKGILERWDQGHVIVLTGVRRCGKSTLMRQMMQELSERFSSEQMLQLNFEDPRLAEDLNFKLIDRCLSLHRQTRCPDKPVYLFLDEVQLVEGWERWVRTQLERQEKLFLCLSGSNASLLSGETATALTGRHHSFEVTPFSFNEFVRGYYQSSENRSFYLAQYLKEGGFPAIIRRQVTQPEETLRQYFDDILVRDIAKRIGSRTGQMLRQIAHMLMDGAGSEQSLTRLSKLTKISVETIREFVSAYEQAFLLFEVPYFSYSVRQRSVRNKKYYPVDTALRRSVLPRRGEDWGKDAETIVYLELRRWVREISYWKGKREIDFIVSRGREILPIQVTVHEEENHRSSVKEAFEEFYGHHPFSEALVLSSAPAFEEKTDSYRIRYIPLIDFLNQAGTFLENYL
ncbi:MAG: ATP-binding protein [Deltaproteobacteria bacterium]|nr:ATP-binding protein [Deltaproteobacteria bacterium]MBI4373752.1 ATP-binding protein [Deltaproteobacteria bacterium]